MGLERYEPGRANATLIPCGAQCLSAKQKCKCSWVVDDPGFSVKWAVLCQGVEYEQGRACEGGRTLRSVREGIARARRKRRAEASFIERASDRATHLWNKASTGAVRHASSVYLWVRIACSRGIGVFLGRTTRTIFKAPATTFVPPDPALGESACE